MQTINNRLAQADCQMKRLLSVGSKDDKHESKGLHQTSKVVAGCFWMLLMMLTMSSYAAEQRCIELSTNCICSEPLNTNSYSLAAGTNWAWNPADTTTKECAVEGAQGGIIDDSSFRYAAVSSGEAITNLPVAHTNTWVLRTFDGSGGQFAGTHFPSNTPTARISLRGYRYYSNGYQFEPDGSVCLNTGKLMQMGIPGPIIVEYSHFHSYAWNTSSPWSPSGDCCWYGPGDSAFQNQNLSAMRGKWFRYELVVRNTITTGTTIVELYRKNVTDNGPNQKILDTTAVTNQPVGVNWSSTFATTLSPGSTVDELWFNLFRNGTCAGFTALSHIMAAAWSTDAGQFIGPAYEIEGGTGGINSTPPPTPGPLLVQ